MHIVFLAGLTSIGKTTTGKQLANLLNYEFISIDSMYDIINNDVNLHSGYNAIDILRWDYERIDDQFKINYWNKLDRTKDYVIEGYVLLRKRELSLILDTLKPQKHTFLFVDPSFEEWHLMVTKKLGEGAGGKFNYDLYHKLIQLPEQYYRLKNVNEALKLSSSTYQHIGYTDIKYRQLNLNNIKNSVCIDIGCADGLIGKYLYMDGAKKVYGVDFVWQALENAKEKGVIPVYNDLNNIDDSDVIWNQVYDKVLCLATFHYIEKQREFINLMRQITRKEFILETPVDDYVRTDVNIPYRDNLEEWLDVFDGFEEIGQSISPDGSFRLIFKCYVNGKT